MTRLEVGDAAAQLAELVAGVAEHGDRVALLHAGVPVATLVSARELRALDETIVLLSNHDYMRQILAGEDAIQNGDLLAGSDLGLLDPSHRFVKTALERASGASAGSVVDHWEMIISGPVRKSLGRLPGHLADAVVRFLFERLGTDPTHAGVELRGFLRRRYCADVETETVIYRLDSVKHSVRILEVLHTGGLVGQTMEPGRSW